MCAIAGRLAGLHGAGIGRRRGLIYGFMYKFAKKATAVSGQVTREDRTYAGMDVGGVCCMFVQGEGQAYKQPQVARALRGGVLVCIPADKDGASRFAPRSGASH